MQLPREGTGSLAAACESRECQAWSKAGQAGKRMESEPDIRNSSWPGSYSWLPPCEAEFGSGLRALNPEILDLLSPKVRAGKPKPPKER